MASDDDSGSAPSGAMTVSPQDRDLWIRTVIGEAGSDASAPGVANVIANRVKTTGQPPSQVVLAPGQFEPWATRRSELMGYGTTSPAYQQAAKIVDGVISGQTPDPTGGATQFYAPIAQAAAGRRPPAWDNGSGIRIGAHVFIGGSPVADDFLHDFPVAGQNPPASAPAPSPSQTQSTGRLSVTAAPPAGAQPPDDFLHDFPVAPPPPQRRGSVTFATPEEMQQIQAEQHGALAASPNDTLLGAGLKNVDTGIIKGAGDVVGMPGNVGSLAGYLLDRGESYFTGRPLEEVQAKNAMAEAASRKQQSDFWNGFGPIGRMIGGIPDASTLPTGSQVAAPILARTGSYVPTTEAGRMLQSGVETVIGALGPGSRGAPIAPGASAFRSTLLRGVAPTATSALAAPAISGAAGQLGTDVTGDPLVGMAAAAAPGLATKIPSMLGNRFLGAVEPETAALARMARDQYGIPVNAGQISESPGLRFTASASSRLPFSGAEGAVADQQTAFNRAISHTLGEDAPKITPNVMQSARTRLGNEFDTVAQGTTIHADPQFATDLHQTLTDAAGVLGPGQIGPLKSQVFRILDTVDPGTRTITGESYQALTRKGTPLDRLQSSADPNVAHYAGQIRNALDDAMQRSAPPDLAERLQTARSQYKAMKTVEDLVEKSPTGDMSPALLMGAVRKSYGNMAYTGASDLGNLARIGQRFLKEPPSSGTAERTSALNTFGKLGLLGGAAFGLHQMPEGAWAIPSSLIAGRAVGGALRSNWMTNALINRSLTPPKLGLPQELVNASVPYFARSRSGNALAPPSIPAIPQNALQP